MNRTLMTLVLVMVSLVGSEALAIKQLVYMAPNDTTFKVEPTGDQTTRFTIVRDPADARQPQNESLKLVRSARLIVSDGDRTILSAPIAPATDNQGKLIYKFEVAQEHVPHVRFVLSEIEDSRHGTGYIGGGTIIEYSTRAPKVIEEALQSVLKDTGVKRP